MKSDDLALSLNTNASLIRDRNFRRTFYIVLCLSGMGILLKILGSLLEKINLFSQFQHSRTYHVLNLMHPC